MRNPSLIEVGAAALSVVSAAAGDAVSVVQVSKVALFKNGYACVDMEAQLPVGAQRAELRQVPIPLLGTVRWDASGGAIRLSGTQKIRRVPAADYDSAELLGANPGRKVALTLKGGATVSGTLTAETSKAEEGSFLPAGKPHACVPSAALLETEGGTQVIPVDTIQSVQFYPGQAVQLPTREEKTACLTVETDAEHSGGKLSLSCISFGMSWLPEYTLELPQDGQEAQLTMRVLLNNELTDLKDVPLQLISGFPALGSALVPSPLTRRQSLSEFLRAIGVMSGESVTDCGEEDEEDTDECYEAIPCLRGGRKSVKRGTERVENMFYYTLPRVSLRRGESAMFELFTCNVPCRDVYTCNVPNQRSLASLSRSQQPPADVWHCVALTNTGKDPWSTGTLCCTKGGNLVARAGMSFTAPGGETLLQLDKVLQAKVTCSEVFKSCESRSAARMRSRHRREDDEVVSIYTGTVEISNHTEKAMELKLTKEVDGTVTGASDGGVINVSPVFSGNPRSRISWTVIVRPGETEKVTYSYDYLDD